MFIDTSVLIWAFRGNEKAMQLLNETDGLFISSVVYIELIQGARNKQELRAIDTTLNMLQVKIIDINEAISLLATNLVKTYFHSHSIELADALIGATASLYKTALITSNVKHFVPIQKLHVIPFSPD
ncbi:MAG: type II toxin-antitoxin system VapC family toxin [Methylococcaceae bacterium]|nr:type II toxin-antitoxin system VapC family toxin [Methylococcaceae bacterium]